MFIHVLWPMLLAFLITKFIRYIQRYDPMLYFKLIFHIFVCEQLVHLDWTVGVQILPPPVTSQITVLIISSYRTDQRGKVMNDKKTSCFVFSQAQIIPLSLHWLPFWTVSLTISSWRQSSSLAPNSESQCTDQCLNQKYLLRTYMPNHSLTAASLLPVLTRACENSTKGVDVKEAYTIRNAPRASQS